MNKFQCIKLLRENGDSILTLRIGDAILATTDFSTKYIRNKGFHPFRNEKDKVTVFSFNDDGFRTLDIKNIKSIKPLSEILNNVKSEDM